LSVAGPADEPNAEQNAEQDALPLYAVRPEGLAALLETLPPAQAAFLRAQHFAASAQSLVLLPGGEGLAGAVLGLGLDDTPFAFGALASALPPSSLWRLVPGAYDPQIAALGFRLGAYVFDHHKTPARAPARLLNPATDKRPAALAGAINYARDLINTPPNRLGPSDLADEVVALAARFAAESERIEGTALANRYPALAAVGAGSDRAPVAVRLAWQGSAAGRQAPLISLCGKGVCFDTGGYDLKPSSAMLRMKKDMGGAAIMMGLAMLIMDADLPVRLELRVGCVENSVSGHAMRPSDVLATHAGLSVEVGNTDAEGRLVLCDLLAEAAAASPAWLLDAATLTGAARVALGPDLPALFCSDESMAAGILAAGTALHDPLWRLPLHDGYAGWLDSKVADLNTVSSRPQAGAIIAALFLRRFVPAGIPWAHIDVYAWNDQSRPGRPEGGEAQAMRALFGAIETRFGA
jgi:leucyl aminopeptidase